MKGSRLQSLDLSEEGVSQEPKRGEGNKGIQTLESGTVRRGREPGAKEMGRGERIKNPADSRNWICPKKA